jgi:hypothetical protein
MHRAKRVAQLTGIAGRPDTVKSTICNAAVQLNFFSQTPISVVAVVTFDLRKNKRQNRKKGVCRLVVILQENRFCCLPVKCLHR